MKIRLVGVLCFCVVFVFHAVPALSLFEGFPGLDGLRAVQPIDDRVLVGFDLGGGIALTSESLVHERTISMRDGLSNGVINDIGLDSQGVIWIATGNGLDRMESISDPLFNNYFTGDGLLFDEVLCLDVASDDVVWIGTPYGLQLFDSGGTAERDDDVWVSFTMADGLVDEYVTSVNVEADHKVWAGTPSGLCLLDFHDSYAKDDDEWICFQGEIGNEPSVSVVKVRSDHVAWIGTPEIGLRRLDYGGTISTGDDIWTEYTTSEGLLSDAVYDIGVDSHGWVWVGHDNGVSWLDDKGTSGTGDDQWIYLTNIGDPLLPGITWLDTSSDENRVYFVQPDTISIHSMDHYGVFDKSGASWNSGNCYGSDVVIGSFVNAVAVDAGGSEDLFIGFNSSYGSDLNRGVARIHWEGSTVQTVKYQEDCGIGDEDTLSIGFEGGTNFKWFGGDEAISKLDDRGTLSTDDDQWLVYTSDELIYGDYQMREFTSFAVDPYDQKWFAGAYGVVTLRDYQDNDKYNDVMIFRHLVMLSMSPPIRVAVAGYPDASNLFWIAGGNPQLTKLIDNDPYMTTDDDYIRIYPYALAGPALSGARDHLNNVWVGSHHYLSVLFENDPSTYTDDFGYPYTPGIGLFPVHQVVKPQADTTRIWTGTPYGANLLEWEGTTSRADDYVLSFTQQDGLLGNNVTSITTDSHGNVFFGIHPGGVSILAPNFGSVSASLQPDGTVLLEWAAKTNNPVSTKTPESVNVYRSLAYEESYVKINLTPLPLSGSYTDANPYKHVTTYYRFELVFDDGSASAEKTDIRWVEPAVEPTDFEISVQEDTMAAVKGDEAVYCVQVISKGGYTGTVTLDAADLPPAYATYDFDPAVVSVPGGSSTLTVQWDGSTPAPPGGTAYPFQVTGDDGTDTVRTVDLLGVVIDPSDHYLTQFVYPVQPHAGRSITVWGRLTPQQDGQIVEVELAGTDAFYTTESDETGFFSVAVPVNTAETHTIRSSYGSTQSAQYDIDVWRGTRYIDMTASTADGTIEPGDLVALDGKITPNPGEEQIYLEIFNQDKESYAFKGNVSVDGYGTFHNTFFAQEGMTAVDVEFDGDADYYNATASLNVPANAPIGMAIVVAGGGQLGNTLWEATEALCDRAYNVFVGRLIPEDQICYLHPDPNHDPDDDEIPERCKDATATKLQEAIEVWALDYVDTSDTSSPFKTPLTIYLMGLEESPGVYRINESETVTTAQLATWIEHFVTNVKALYTDPEIPAPQTVPVNVVLEFKRSGQFVDELTGSDRIVVTSTGDGSTQYPGYNHVSDLGDVSFSHTFYDSINMGKYIAEGWAEAAEQMGDFEDPTSGFAQKPLIDANGDGTPNQAQDTNSEIGAGNKLLEYRNTYDVRPEIRSIFPVLTIPLGHSDATVWAQVLDHDEGLDKIKCMILPPHDSSESMREYPMVFNDLMNRYELTHDGFHSRGTYRILITAMDLDGDHALVKDSKIHVLLNTSEEDTTAPADVSGLSAIAEDQQVSLSWAVSSSDDLAGYRVYTKASGGTYGSGIYIGNDDHYTVTGLTNGLSYVFKVTAEDEVPNESEGVETGPVSPRGAQFIADTTEVLPGGTVQFTDQSTGSPTGYEWDLDGDDVIDSTDPNPSFTYNALGTYTVKLKATYADAWLDWEIKTAYIEVKTQAADFHADQTHGTLPFTVHFTDDSASENPITSWEWDLNGVPATIESTDPNPTYEYTALGEFDVTLTITTADGTDSTTKVEYIVTSCAVPDVSFTSNVRAAPAPLAVHFTSTTPTQYTGCDPTSWDWDFGDTGTGSGEETDHTYIDSGIFDVCLEVQVPGTSAQTCVDDYIVTSPEIELTAPVGSESWPAGTEQQIAYTLRGNPHDWVSHVRVSVSPDSGATYEEIAVVPTDSGSAGDYQTAWPVPIARGDAFRVQVVAEDGSDVQVASDQSDSDFAVTLVYEPTAELDAATGEVTLTWKGGDADIWALDGVYDASFAGGYLLAAEEQSPYVDSPPAGARAYRFANLGTDAFSPATVGKADLAISLGYNLLAVPLLPDQELYASQAAADMNGQDGNVIELAKWDHLSGSWLTHDPSWPLVDFPINAGEGFFLKAGCDSTWSVAGEVARGDRVCTQTAHGYAMFGVPTREFAMASDAAAAMLSQGCTPTEISRWLASAGIWQTHDLSWPVVDFPIDATDGFFVKAGSDAPFILNPMDVQAEAMSATEAQVTFATDVPGVAWVVYGTDPENLDSRAYDDLGVLHADTDHQITLTDLEPDTTYFLDIVFLGVVYNKRGEHYAVQTPE